MRFIKPRGGQLFYRVFFFNNNLIVRECRLNVKTIILDATQRKPIIKLRINDFGPTDGGFIVISNRAGHTITSLHK